jgi:thiamine pyrophosphate-dependent acetolactate synthase large subunit-like protein
MADEETQAGGGVIRDLDMMVEVDGEMIRIGDLVDTVLKAGEMVPEIDTLRAFQEATNRFIRRDGEQHEIADAASKMLAGVGYTDQEIKEYVRDWTQSQNETQDDGEETAEEAEEDTQEEPEMTQQNDPRYERLERETKQMRLRMMQEEMKKGVVSAIDENGEIAKMLMGLDKSRGREHATGAYQAIQDQVRKATLDRLYDRRDKSGGNFSEDWIQEEAAKAAEEVARSYATVIGDLGSLGRAPETVSEMDTITSKPPVPAPEFKKGMDRGSVDSAVREFNTDTLTRLALDVSAGGDTKA